MHFREGFKFLIIKWDKIDFKYKGSSLVANENNSTVISVLSITQLTSHSLDECGIRKCKLHCTCDSDHVICFTFVVSIIIICYNIGILK